MSSKKNGYNTPDYPYALTFMDKDTPNKYKATPEEIGRTESLHNQAWVNDSYDKPKRPKPPNNHSRRIGESIPETERTPQQQRLFLRNLVYRLRYQERRVKDKLIKFKELLRTTNPNFDPIYHAKVSRNLKRTEERLEEIYFLKDKYNFDE